MIMFYGDFKGPSHVRLEIMWRDNYLGISV